MTIADAGLLSAGDAGLGGEGRSPKSRLVPAFIAIIIFSSLSLASNLASEGFLEADGCTHYLYARFAIEEPHYLVNVWGRPVCTAIYAIPALLGGVTGVRVMSLLLALACSIVAMRIAMRQGHRQPALALIFMLAQPLVFFHSFSELTELPFALFLILGFWAYQHRRWGWMALLIGMTPLGRPEGFGFLAMAATALILHRRAAWLLVLPLPLLLWNHAGWDLYGRQQPWWRWLGDNWPYAAESLYPAGALWHFLLLLPVVTSPFIFPAMLAGIAASLSPGNSVDRDDSHENDEPDGFIRSRLPAWSRGFFDSHTIRCQWLIALIPLLIFVGHSLLYWMGKMASNGELRYMLAVAPFWALLSARGWEWAFIRFQWRRPLVWAGVAALLPMLINIAYPAVPLVLAQDWRQSRHIAEWYESSGVERTHPRVMAAHMGIYYFLDRSPSGDRSTEFHQKNLLAPPPGTIMIWDGMYALYNSDAARAIPLEDVLASGWVEDEDAQDLLQEIKAAYPLGLEWRIFKSPEPALVP